MLNELSARVDALEKRHPDMQQIQQTIQIVANQLIDNALLASKPLDRAKVEEVNKQIKAVRSMCPKCGVKPNYFFHVKTCNGQKEKQKDADTDRRRDQGKT